MKIAIIAHHRTGSTALSYWLSMELGYKFINEPFNLFNYVNDEIYQNSINEDNILVKYIFHHFTNETQINEIINIFDKVIILTRNNIRECAISIVHANSVGNCHTKYILDDDWFNKNENLIKIQITNLTHNNKQIKEITGGLHITYEGIYETKEDISKLIEYLKLYNLKHINIIDGKNKYKITDGILPDDTSLHVLKPYVHILKPNNIYKRKLI